MDKIVQEAAQIWGLNSSDISLAAQRENIVYKVSGARPLALRFHRSGYRTAAQLRSELLWSQELARNGLSVPEPIPNRSGELISEINGVLVDVLEWLPGAPLGAAGSLVGIDNLAGDMAGSRVEFCRHLGRTMAMMHDISDVWEVPTGFIRPHWDRAGLLGDAPIWGRFWDHPDISSDERDVLLQARSAADAHLARLEEGLDYGLIHADLISENMLWDPKLGNGKLSFIDFDDGGFGFRDFELATFLFRFRDANDYLALRSALCDGYSIRRRIDLGSLDLLMLLRALTYPGWIMSRLDEPGAAARSTRAIDAALSMARAYLDTLKG